MLVPTTAVGADATAPLVDGIHDVKAMAGNSTNVLVAGDYLFVLAADGTAIKVADNLNITALAVDDQQAYYISDAVLYAVDLADPTTPATPTMLTPLDDVNFRHWLILENGNLYWNGATGVETIPTSGGTPVVFAPAAALQNLTVFHGALYFLDGDDLRHVALP